MIAGRRWHSIAGSLNPGSFSQAPRMPTLGEDDLRSSTRSASFPGAPRFNAGRGPVSNRFSTWVIVWVPVKPPTRVSCFWRLLIFAE
jgi:hypothetical protein